MSLRDFLTNVSVILTVMAAAALIETAVHTPAARAETVVYGLDEGQRLAEVPFPSESDPNPVLSDTKVRFEAGTGR
jgi:NaMN:DMB phosphoribosyltransferase